MHEKATFAAGGFWHVEDAFRKVKGVVSTRTGYTGGIKHNPTYIEVGTGKTGHAEAVEILFDPSQVSYSQLLEMFWVCHDPTSVNRQGRDVGPQYRSAIFYHGEAQKAAAIASKVHQERVHPRKRPVVTEIVPAGIFYEAEEFHQQYLERRSKVVHHTLKGIAHKR